MGRYSNPFGAKLTLERLRDLPKVSRTKKAPALRARRLTRAEHDQILDEYTARTPVKEIARSLSVHISTVEAHLRRSDVERHGRGPILHGEALARACDLYGEGESLRAIAQQLGVGRESVRSGLRRAGVEIRPR
jgi:DNA-binding CsgD family transcriptional regulator